MSDHVVKLTEAEERAVRRDAWLGPMVGAAVILGSVTVVTWATWPASWVVLAGTAVLLVVLACLEWALGGGR